MFAVGASLVSVHDQPVPAAGDARARVRSAGLPPAAARGLEVLDDLHDDGGRGGQPRRRRSTSGCTRATCRAGSTATTRAGLISTVPEVFGLPSRPHRPRVCQAEGSRLHLPRDVVAPAPVVARPARRRRELAALRQQLYDLQSASAELVGTGEMSGVLQRIIERAASERPRARVPAGRRPRPTGARRWSTPSASRAAQVDALAASAARRGRPRAAVRSSSTSSPPAATTAGWPRCTPTASTPRDERRLLAAYAGHAAAALDLLSALDDSRRDGAARRRAARRWRTSWPGSATRTTWRDRRRRAARGGRLRPRRRAALGPAAGGCAPPPRPGSRRRRGALMGAVLRR